MDEETRFVRFRISLEIGEMVEEDSVPSPGHTSSLLRELVLDKQLINEASLQHASDTLFSVIDKALAPYRPKKQRLPYLVFPVLGGGKNDIPSSVPYAMLSTPEIEAAAMKNHGQTIKRLAERGGLSIKELFAVLFHIPLSDVFALPERYTTEHCTDRVNKLVERWGRG